MKALLVGYGGIGCNVYYPEMLNLGYDIDILDKNIISDKIEIKYNDINQIKDSYDLAVICTPNFTHGKIANDLANIGTKRIFIEKPGLESSHAWWKQDRAYTSTQFHLVKNNLYRNEYGLIDALLKDNEIIGVDINWLNKNRIPNPGTWFTNPAQAFGGVSYDLMPHMYCFLNVIFGATKLDDAKFRTNKYQRWNLSNIIQTDYGQVNLNGLYHVDDVAEAFTTIDNISVRMKAAWKEGYDKQSITLFFKNGSTYEWEFGLCPANAYGKMLQDTADSFGIDMRIHKFLEEF